jgi:histidinol dehydrogenase
MSASPFDVADAAIAGVRARGDAFVREEVARFDGVRLDALSIAPRAVNIDDALAKALDTAIERIASFHEPQLPRSYRWTRGDSAITHRVRPLRRVGIYVPGGRAVYLSTLIMAAVPARIAGVAELVVCTTPAAAERDELHWLCNRLGIRELYRAGGAAGIAALALGTGSLERVDKIVGPGNAYVTAAKTRLTGTVGIDMTAGPTELVVICDETADAALVQADLDAQAEHGEDSVVTCIRVGASYPIRATRVIDVATIEEAISIANRIAPEHLSIQTRDAERAAEGATDCGAIFCGPFSAVAAGDYIAGPNHILPTGGSARFFSPLGVYDFIKRSNVISLGGDDFAAIGAAGARIAELEGLPMHAASLNERSRACPAATSPR